MEGRKWRDYESHSRLISGEPDAPPCPDEKLPPGWRISEINGEMYYYNRRTGKRQYNHPNNCNKEESELPPSDEPRDPERSLPSPIPEEQLSGLSDGLSDGSDGLDGLDGLDGTSAGDAGGLVHRELDEGIERQKISQKEYIENQLKILEGSYDDLLKHYEIINYHILEIDDKILKMDNKFEELNNIAQSMRGGGLRNTKKRGKTKKRKKSKKRKNTKKRKYTKKGN